MKLKIQVRKSGKGPDEIETKTIDTKDLNQYTRTYFVGKELIEITIERKRPGRPNKYAV